MIKLTISSPAPKVRRPYGQLLGIIAAAVITIFVLVHLFRIDTFIPELSYALPVSQRAASLIALLLISAELFAIPFLLRMSLSLLARFCSGILVIVAPLAWLLIAVWNYGNSVSTAQLGAFYSLPSGALLIGFNILWLALNYVTLWALGFDLPKRLSKTR